MYSVALVVNGNTEKLMVTRVQLLLLHVIEFIMIIYML